MIQDLLLPFIFIGLSEFGDKTQLAVLCLSAKTKSYAKLLFGIVSAFFLTTLMAVLFGRYITSVLPISYIRIAAGIVFICMGFYIFFQKMDNEVKCDLHNPFLSSFSLVFLMELGDKSQLASAVFAAEYDPVLVFIGVLLSLTLLSVLAIYVGRRLFEKMSPQIASKAAGVLFVIIGVAALMVKQ